MTLTAETFVAYYERFLTLAGSVLSKSMPREKAIICESNAVSALWEIWKPDVPSAMILNELNSMNDEQLLACLRALTFYSTTKEISP